MPDETNTPIEGLGDASHDAAEAVGVGDFDAMPHAPGIDVSHVGATKLDSTFKRPQTGRHGKMPRMGGAAGSGESGADPVKMRAAADLGDKKIALLHEKLATLMAAVKATEANDTWQGTAAVDYRDAFLNILQNFDKQLERFSAYPRELRAYADQHEGAIDEANRAAVEAAEAAQAANWTFDI